MIKYAAIGVFALGLVALVVRGVFHLVMPTTTFEPLSLFLLGVGLVTVGAVARRKLPLT